jgi:hypothetical protein
MRNVSIQVRTVGCPRWPRFLVVDENSASFWTGDGWADNSRRGLLYNDRAEATHDRDKLLAESVNEEGGDDQWSEQ